MLGPTESFLKWTAIVVSLGAMLFHLLDSGKYFLSIIGVDSPKSLPAHDSVFESISFRCSPQTYTIEILSIDPFIMYINNFLSDIEIEYILKFSNDRLERASSNEKAEESKTISLATRLPRRDPVNVCLSQRMKSLLGNVQHMETEPIRVVRYEGEDKIQIHYDWFPDTRRETGNPDMPMRENNRLGSIFAYIGDDCEGGETYFPEVESMPEDADGDKFSRSENGRGLLIKPRRGNAIFWNNLHPNGSGDIRTAHAGMPVTKGIKIGLNIWSYYFLDSLIIG